MSQSIEKFEGQLYTLWGFPYVLFSPSVPAHTHLVSLAYFAIPLFSGHSFASTGRQPAQHETPCMSSWAGCCCPWLFTWGGEGAQAWLDYMDLWSKTTSRNLMHTATSLCLKSSASKFLGKWLQQLLFLFCHDSRNTVYPLPVINQGCALVPIWPANTVPRWMMSNCSKNSWVGFDFHIFSCQSPAYYGARLPSIK